MNRPVLALLMPSELADFFGPQLARLMPQVEVAYGEGAATMTAEFAIAIAPPPGQLATMPALRCVIAPGAGVDHILADPAYPPGLMLARMSQPDLRQRMVEYVLLHVLRHHRRVLDFEAQQRAGVWDMLWPQKAAAERTVGVLGLGELGAPIAQVLAGLGFEVRGWARSAKTLGGVETYEGAAQFKDFLSDVEILVNLLPLTPQTRGLIDAEALAALPRGASVINAGRGATMVEDDLLAGLDSGQIDSATLDVFAVEPLPAGHRFWGHPRVTITPHCASAVTPEAMATGAMAAIEAVLAGHDPPQRVDLARGY